jgi:hypothetical protein
MFLHIDEDGLERVVDNAKARAKGGFSCKIVNANAVMLEDNALAAAKDREDVRAALGVGEAEIYGELREFRKRVNIDGLVDLYADLQVKLDAWYDLCNYGRRCYCRLSCTV